MTARPGEPTGDTLEMAYRDQRKQIDGYAKAWHGLRAAAEAFLDANCVGGPDDNVETWDARFDALAIILGRPERAADFADICPECREENAT